MCGNIIGVVGLLSKVPSVLNSTLRVKLFAIATSSNSINLLLSKQVVSMTKISVAANSAAR